MEQSNTGTLFITYIVRFAMTDSVCPNCGATVPFGMPSCNSCGTPIRSSQGPNTFCANCGSILTDKNMPCLQCGHVKTTFNNNPIPNSPQGLPAHMMYKNEGNALILAVVLGIFGLNGIGHIYIGKIGKGIGLLIGSIVLFAVGIATLLIFVGIIFLIMYFALFIWQIIDARNLCKEYNHAIKTTGNPPINW